LIPFAPSAPFKVTLALDKITVLASSLVNTISLLTNATELIEGPLLPVNPISPLSPLSPLFPFRSDTNIKLVQETSPTYLHWI
jgi:hypothetical protein